MLRSQPFITHRTYPDKFYPQVNILIDWHKVDKQIKNAERNDKANSKTRVLFMKHRIIVSNGAKSQVFKEKPL